MSNSLTQGKNPVTGFPLDIEADITHKGLVMTDPDHHLIHKGQMFYLSGSIAALGAGATTYFHGLTDTLTVHFRAASIQSDGAPININFYEGATVSANGTPLTVYNRKRSSTTAPTMLTFGGPTVTDVGTLIDSGAILLSGPSKQSGIADLFAAEWVLDLPTTSYLIGITNNTVGAVDVYYSFLWYED